MSEANGTGTWLMRWILGSLGGLIIVLLSFLISTLVSIGSTVADLRVQVATLESKAIQGKELNEHLHQERQAALQRLEEVGRAVQDLTTIVKINERENKSLADRLLTLNRWLDTKWQKPLEDLR